LWLYWPVQACTSLYKGLQDFCEVTDEETSTTHPPSLQQLAGVLSSVTESTQNILGGNPVFLDEVRNIYRSFLTSPTTCQLLGSNPLAANPTTPPSETFRKEILNIKESITALSTTVSSLLPKATAPRATTQPENSTPARGHP
jgi:hypothetical protein